MDIQANSRKETAQHLFVLCLLKLKKTSRGMVVAQQTLLELQCLNAAIKQKLNKRKWC
jgi:hypothetical protein